MFPQPVLCEVNVYRRYAQYVYTPRADASCLQPAKPDDSPCQLYREVDRALDGR